LKKGVNSPKTLAYANDFVFYGKRPLVVLIHQKCWLLPMSQGLNTIVDGVLIRQKHWLMPIYFITLASPAEGVNLPKSWLMPM